MRQPQGNPGRHNRLLILTLFIFFSLCANSDAFNFPGAGWHRGDAAFAQENSRAALLQALNSANPNIELDIIDFVDQSGRRLGLVSHDYLMKRATGLPGAFSENFNDISKLPLNAANPALPPPTVYDHRGAFRDAQGKESSGHYTQCFAGHEG